MKSCCCSFKGKKKKESPAHMKHRPNNVFWPSFHSSLISSDWCLPLDVIICPTTQYSAYAKLTYVGDINISCCICWSFSQSKKKKTQKRNVYLNVKRTCRCDGGHVVLTFGFRYYNGSYRHSHIHKNQTQITPTLLRWIQELWVPPEFDPPIPSF